VLVEARSANDTDLLSAVSYAGANANVVSMSWGGPEFGGENSDDPYFSHAGTTFVASSGDNGAPASWPASSPNVVAVGGTTLTLTSSNNWSGETGWSGSGGGPSAYEAQPSFQSGVVTQQTSVRGTPDVAYDASPSSGFAVYDSFAYNRQVLGWLAVGGTSAGSPQWAALVAIADQGRTLTSQPALNSSSPQEVLKLLYSAANRGDFHDLTSGASAGRPAYFAGPGYDYVTGLGSPIANLLVPALAGTTAVASSDSLVISASSSDTAGTAFSVTITARKPGGATDTAYAGTVHFTSTDGQAVLPADYTFSAGDAGKHTFTVTLKTAASQSLTVTDTSNPIVTGSLPGIVVNPAAANSLVLSGVSGVTTSGAGQSVTVTARDPYGNVATGYVGTVHFTSTDASVALPSDYTFTSADHGVHTFAYTLVTPGTQSITVADHGITVNSGAIAVAPVAPLNLAVKVASNTQINLSWTGSQGATGYQIQRSTSPTSGWTQVGSTAAGTTTFQDTGLNAGTTYYYRVRAIATGNIASAYSNVASATTTGSTSTSSADTLWANSYVPTINAYSWGSYEVGVKFRADVSGTVTGLRFYKQTWMNGFYHVGHLWSSTGQLLASALFSETYSGWQQVTLSNPVAISPNTVYIVSFWTGGGYFGISTSFFSGSGVDNGPLHALANGISGGDGVYGYGYGAFPSTSGAGMNFWADVVFAPSSTGTNAIVNIGSPAGGGIGHFQVIAAPGNSSAGSSATTNSSAGSGSSSSASRYNANTTGSWPYRQTTKPAQSFGSSSRKWNGYEY
jgi:hypothetical protein